jgi:hypothetical protein
MQDRKARGGRGVMLKEHKLPMLGLLKNCKIVKREVGEA